jgi:hypothetical protein
MKKSQEDNAALFAGDNQGSNADSHMLNSLINELKNLK